MKRFILPILLILVISSVVLVSCNEATSQTEPETKAEETVEGTTAENDGGNTTTTKKPSPTDTRPTWGTIPSTTTAAPTTKAPKPVFTKKDIQYKDPASSDGTGSGSGSTGTGSGSTTPTPEEPTGNGNDLNLNEAPIPADPEKVTPSNENGVAGGNEAPIIKNDIVNFLIKVLG